MTFKEILPFLKEGKKIKLPEWKGFWKKEPNYNTVYMYCKDGRIVDINGEMDDVFYTLDFIVRDDWKVCDDDYHVQYENNELKT